MRFLKPFTVFTIVFFAAAAVSAQQTNPVDRQVSNPITDTPNINPISAEQNIAAPKPKKGSVQQEGGDN